MKIRNKILLSLSIFFGLIFVTLYGVGYRIYRVPGLAMVPTIPQNSFVIGKLSASAGQEVRRYDLVICRDPYRRNILRIVRVIGLPGETVAMPPKGLTIDGQLLSLPVCMKPGDIGSGKHNFSLWQRGVKIPSSAVFVLGDNPKHSPDSRSFGPIPLMDVVGKVISRDNAEWH